MNQKGLPQKKTLLITGATGFVGRHLVKQLIESQAYTVRTLTREKTVLEQPHLAPIYTDDITQYSDWSAGLTGCDVVIHLAARVHVMREYLDDPLSEYRKINVTATLNLARQAAQQGVKRFIFVSSIGVNGKETQQGLSYKPDDIPRPQEAYSQSKWEAEQALAALCQETGMALVILRPPIIYGPGVKGNFKSMMSCLKKGIPLPLKSVENQRSLVSVYNVVDLIIHCINHPRAVNQTFLVSDGQDVSIGELLKKLAQAMDQSARLFPVPERLLMKLGYLLGQQVVVQRLCGSLQVDITKTRELLDWKPVVSMDEALRRTVEDA